LCNGKVTPTKKTYTVELILFPVKKTGVVHYAGKREEERASGPGRKKTVGAEKKSRRLILHVDVRSPTSTGGSGGECEEKIRRTVDNRILLGGSVGRGDALQVLSEKSAFEKKTAKDV